MMDELALNPTRSIYSVFGNICNDPNFLKSPEVVLASRDFVQQFHKIVFIALNNLAYSDIEVNNITPIDIDNYLSSYPVYYKIWDENDGVRYIDDVKNHANNQMFHSDYERLKKYSLLRNYVEEGFDVSDIYDYKSHDLKELNESSQKLEEMTTVEIIEHYTQKMNKIREDWNTESGDVLDFKAGDDLDTLLDRIQKDPDLGYPFQNGYYNKLFRGMRKGKFLLRSASTGAGKAVTYNTNIPTPIGYVKAKDVKVGDVLFDEKGQKTNVVGVYPQGVQDVYEVTLQDGRKVECNAEHIWTYIEKGSNKYKDITTEEMLKNGLQKGKRGAYQYKLPIAKEVQYEKRELSVDPYVVGAFIGDGSLRSDQLIISNPEKQICEEIARLIGVESTVRNKHNFDNKFPLNQRTFANGHWREYVHTRDIFGKMPELFDKYSHEKSIPEDYLMSSVEDRWSLLQGLMDTDGTIYEGEGNRIRVSYCTTSEKLAYQVRLLAHSLGCHAYVNSGKRKGNRRDYRISIGIPNADKHKLFRMCEHKKIIAEKVKNYPDRKLYDRVAVVKIEKLDKQENQVCFTVDSENHLFLVEDYVVTHNTRQAIRDMCTVACKEIYVTGKGWVSLGPACPALFISTELDKEEVQLIMLAFITGISDSVIKDGNYDAGTALRLNKGLEVLKESPLYASYIGDFSISDIEMKIEQYVINEGVEYVSFDYVQMVPKLSKTMQQNFGQNLREDQILVHFSAALKNIATRYNIFLESSTQLNRGSKEVENRDATSLRGGWFRNRLSLHFKKIQETLISGVLV